MGITGLGVKFSPELIVSVPTYRFPRIFDLLITEVYFRPFFFEIQSYFFWGVLKNVGTTCLGVKFSPESIALVPTYRFTRIFELLITEVYFRPFCFEFQSYFFWGGCLYPMMS